MYKIKVVHIFHGLDYGGIETMLVNIANMQVLQGLDVSIVIIDDNINGELKSKLDANINFFNLKRRIGSFNFSFISRLNSVLDIIEPNIIHLHTGVIANYLSNRWLSRASCVVTLHALPAGKVGVYSRLGRIIQNLLFHNGGNVMNLNRVDKVYSISKAVAQSLKDKFDINSIVIENGIDTNSFKLRTYKEPASSFQIVQLGRLDHNNKGQDVLINAVSILKSRGVDCHVCFIGGGQSREFLENLVQEGQLQDEISFLGPKSQMYVSQNLCEYDLLIQPSRFEGFGLTVAEAMSSRLPVLVSEGQGPSEVTMGNEFGWTFTNGDSTDLANKIQYLIEHYDLALAKANDALAHVKQLYDVKNTASKYVYEYSLLCNLQ